MTLENDLREMEKRRNLDRERWIAEMMQENADADYIATIRHAANALRDHGFEPQQVPVFQPFDNIYSSSNNERPTPERLVELARRRLQYRARWDRAIENVRSVENVFCSTPVPDIKIKTPLMDRKYPHFCQNPKCKTRLRYEHAFKKACEKYEVFTAYVNNSFIKCDMKIVVRNAKKAYAFEKQFRKWWRSKYVKFLCCTCYRNATQPTMQEQLDHLHAEAFSVEFRSELDNDYYENP